MAQTFGTQDPRLFHLDGAIEFPPHKLSDNLPGRPTPDAYSDEFSGRVIEYDDFVKVSLAENAPAYPLIKTAVPSWDNEARRPNRGLSLELSTPERYQNWVQSLVTRAISQPQIGGVNGRAVVAINAWNEWSKALILNLMFISEQLISTPRRGQLRLPSRRMRRRDPLLRLNLPLPLTVILPNFNHAKFLVERIISVLKQTVKPAEIIFLDDCSSDNSVEIARDLLQQSNIPYKIIQSQKNSGNVFRQWIKGIEEATSEWIWIAETDDCADHRFLGPNASSRTRGHYCRLR